MSIAETLLSISIDARRPVSLRRQLFAEMQRLLLDGSLPAGTRLPSTRALARALGLSRATVVDVFDQLIADGIIWGRSGSGTFVVGGVTAESSPSLVAASAAPERLSERGTRLVAASSTTTYTSRARPIGAFRNGVPAVDAFPRDVWGRQLGKAARRARADMLDYAHPSGYLPLRRAIAERLAITRGIRCTAEQVIVVEGTQQALDFTAQLLVDPGDPVCMEDPGYLAARSAFRAAGANIVACPVDADGFNVVIAEQRAPVPRIICVSPSHQYPVGVTLSLARRSALLDWASRASAWIVEDDYESEFRYDGRQLDALLRLDTHGRVIYVGTFSKTMFPSLRIGYVVAPPSLVDAFHAIRRVTGIAPKTIEQAALAAFIDDGDFARHVSRMRRLYARRQDALVDAVDARLAGILTVRRAQSGLHLLGCLRHDVSDREVASIALDNGIYVAPASALALEAGAWNGLLMGYAISAPQAIRAGVETLARCIEGVTR